MNDKVDIEQRKHSLCGQINDVVCYFGKRQSFVKLKLMRTYCTSFYGSVLLMDFSHPAISAFCTTWRKGIRRIWGIPYCTHGSLLPVMSNYLPLLDELCCRSAAFIKSCLESDSPIVSAVAHYGVYYGRMNSHIGRNAFFCCSRDDVADILCFTRCMVSRYVDEYISPQLRASVLLLLELLFTRDGSFSCSLLSLHEIDELIDIVCTL